MGTRESCTSRFLVHCTRDGERNKQKGNRRERSQRENIGRSVGIGRWIGSFENSLNNPIVSDVVPNAMIVFPNNHIPKQLVVA